MMSSTNERIFIKTGTLPHVATIIGVLENKRIIIRFVKTLKQLGSILKECNAAVDKYVSKFEVHVMGNLPKGAST